MAGTARKNRHVFEAIGFAKVVIEDGKVTEVGQPRLGYCPLYKKFRGMDEITPEAIRENMEFRIREFGLCTENRKVRAGDYVTFGISEILSTALGNGAIDAAVVAADGCGTAVITEPDLLQGLCGRISGLVETSPLQTVLNAVGRDNVVDPAETPIDQIKGAEMADGKGFGKFAVTVARPRDAEELRRRYGDRIIIVAVHTSCINSEGAKTYFDRCDMITACASAPLREEAAKRDVVVAGNKVQIYGVTDIGKKMVVDKLTSIGRKPYAGEPLDEPRPLLSS